MKITVEFNSIEEFEAFRGSAPVKAEKKQTAKQEKEFERSNTFEESMDSREPVQEEPAEETKEEVTLTVDDVRPVLMKVKKAKGAEVLSQLLGSFGAAKLTQVDSSEYPELLKKAEEILNA